MKAPRGLGLKKQMLSDCDFKNLSRVDDGTRGDFRGRTERIAAGEAVALKL